MTTEKMKTKGTPNKIDIHVGSRLRVRRSLLGLSQEKLSDAIGITFQQIQKYEKGTNRISAGRLYEFSKILDVPVSYFYENMAIAHNALKKLSAMPAIGFSDNEQEEFESLDKDVMQTKETLNLIRHYYAIEDEELRKDVLRLLKNMATQNTQK